MLFILILASVFEQKEVTGQGSVIVSLGEYAKWNKRFTCNNGSIAYRKGHLITLDVTISSNESSIRLLDIDTLNGHLNIISSNRDSINNKMMGISRVEKRKYFHDNLDDTALVNFQYFMKSRIHTFTSLPSQKSIVTNFGQYDDQASFWQMTTDASFTIKYDRDEMKPLKHQWNKMLGPISLSGVDVFNIQYDCINGNLQQ